MGSQASTEAEAVWASRLLSSGGVLWEALDASSPSSVSPDAASSSKAYWVFSEKRQEVSLPCVAWTSSGDLGGGTRWDARAQRYVASASVNTSDEPVEPRPPETFQAILDGRDAAFRWNASERFTDGGPIPAKASIRYRVYRDGVPVFESQDTRFEDRLPSDGPHRYYVTASVVDPSGAYWESKRSEDIDMVSVVSSLPKAHDAFEVPVAVTQIAGAALPQLAFIEYGGELVAHLAFVVRDQGTGLGDHVRYLRSVSGGRRGSWSPPLSLKSGDGGEISDLAISSHRAQVVLAWIEKGPSVQGSSTSRVQVLESDDSGVTWPTAPRVARHNDHWKRGLNLAHDVLGALHAVWGEAGKVYYVKDFLGKPRNVFDVPRRKIADEIVKHKVRYEEGDSGCRCADCWCEESYVLGGTDDADVHWVEEHTMHEPSLHVDQRGVHIVARRSAMWDNVPVPNPAWDAMLASEPVYSQERIYGERVTRPVVGWRKTWKRAREPGDEAELSKLGVSFQYLYAGTWHHGDRIVLAQRPLDGVLPAWQITTLDAGGDSAEDLLAHPGIGSGPEGRLYAVYERGPSRDPNALGHNALVLMHSEDGGQSWSAGRAVGQGYMPKLASTSNTLAVLSYAPYAGDDGPRKTPGGVIQLARTSDGRAFTHETVNVFWNPKRSEDEVAAAGAVHRHTHGTDADALEGVPVLVAHDDLLAAAWVGAPQGPLGSQDVPGGSGGSA